VGNVYVCGPQHQNGGPGSFNCSDGKLLKSVEFLDPYEPAHWELSIIPYPHWNGIISLDLVIWDPELFSYSANFKLTVRPINDPPTIVLQSTSVHVEYYKHDDTKQNSPWVRIEHSGSDTASFSLKEKDPAEYRDRGGQVLDEKKDGSQKSDTATTLQTDNNLKQGELKTVYRLRTTIQDRDFFFGYDINVTGSLINGQWIPALAKANSGNNKRFKQDPNKICAFDGLYTVNCRAEINDLDEWMTTVGFPLVIDAGSDLAIGLFILNDTGSIDWLGRPLATGFVIEFYPPKKPAVLAAPIAAVVILPVIAAATAAAIAAAWIVLGKRATEYAGAGFDQFDVVGSQGATRSPLYDDGGLDVTSGIYHDPHGAH